MSSYATKTDWKRLSDVDRSNLAVKWDLASLKAELDKINIDKIHSFWSK